MSTGRGQSRSGTGTYELLEEKRNGGRTVRLHGERLDGVDARPAKLDGDPKNWLLLRKDGADAASTHYAPMLSTSSETLPSRRGLGVRAEVGQVQAIVTIVGGEVTLTSRNGNDLTGRFAEAARAAQLGIRAPDAVLDGEICALDARTVGHVSRCSRRSGTLVLVLFDLLELDSEPLVDLPLEERRERLEGSSRPVPVPFSCPLGSKTVRPCSRRRARRGLEGVVAKRVGSLPSQAGAAPTGAR